MKKQILLGSVVVFMLYGTTVNAQVTVPTNVSPAGTPFVGWNGTGVVRPLEIRNNFNQPINFWTNGDCLLPT